MVARPRLRLRLCNWRKPRPAPKFFAYLRKILKFLICSRSTELAGPFQAKSRRHRQKSAQLAVFVAADAVFAVDFEAVEVGKQPALGLCKMQADGRRLTAIGEQFSDVVHMGLRLVLWRKLFERHQRSRERLRDDPSVVAGDSLFRHQLTPHLVAPHILPRSATDRHQAVEHGYSTLRPANFTTFAHFSVSSAINVPNWAGVPLIGSPLMAAKRAFIAASAKAALVSLLRRSTISAGVLTGTASPYHWLAS